MHILKNLVTLSKPINELSDDLSRLDWDYEGKPFVITSSHIRSILGRFLEGKINEKEIEDWANLLECREDIEYKKENQVQLEEIIYTLANPIIEGNITFELCENMYLRLID